MTRVLVDIGNSRLKYAVVDGAMGAPVSLACDDAVAYQLANVWRHLAVPASLKVGSVGDTRILEQVAAIAHSLGWPSPCLAQVRCRYKGLRVGYDDLNGLGVDRWLAMLGARVRCTGAFIVIDAGTAVTFDGVDAQGNHRGGGIVPGLSAMRGALPPVSRQRHPESPWLAFPATNTGEGIDAATLLGLADLISGLTERLARAIGDSNPAVFIAGGDAPALLPYLAMSVHHRHALVLQGLDRLSETEMTPL